MDKNKELLQKYIDAAADLAESVKRNIVHEGVIDDETVLKLNAFYIASNAVADMIVILNTDPNELDEDLN